MPLLVCWSCGRQVHATSPLESLFADERRCPRCRAHLGPERRVAERRRWDRRQRAPGDPGPPARVGERRVAERRVAARRRPA